MKKNIFLIVIFLIITGSLSAQSNNTSRQLPFFTLYGGPGTSDVLVDGISFSFFLNPVFSLTPAISIGSKNGLHVSTDDIIALETQAFFRWNFLRFGSREDRRTLNFFVQGGVGFLGAHRGPDIRNSRSSLLFDATIGVTIPLTSRLSIEATGRGGYPFITGFALTLGYSIPLPVGTVYMEGPERIIYLDHDVYVTEYVEVIRTLPPEEIVSRILISQVEYIIFAPDISVYNDHIDHDAQSLNDLVLDHTALILRENPDYRVRLEGHANPVTRVPGEIEELLILSQARANEVARQLTLRGVADEQIIVIAYGGERIVAAAEDHDHWNMNRRVEIIVIQVDAN